MEIEWSWREAGVHLLNEHRDRELAVRRRPDHLAPLPVACEGNASGRLRKEVASTERVARGGASLAGGSLTAASCVSFLERCARMLLSFLELLTLLSLQASTSPQAA